MIVCVLEDYVCKVEKHQEIMTVLIIKRRETVTEEVL